MDRAGWCGDKIENKIRSCGQVLIETDTHRYILAEDNILPCKKVADNEYVVKTVLKKDWSISYV